MGIVIATFIAVTGSVSPLQAITLSIYEIQYTDDANGVSPKNGNVVDCFGGIVTHKRSGGRPRLILQDPNYSDGWGAIQVKGWSNDAFDDVAVQVPAAQMFVTPVALVVVPEKRIVIEEAPVHGFGTEALQTVSARFDDAYIRFGRLPVEHGESDTRPVGRGIGMRQIPGIRTPGFVQRVDLGRGRVLRQLA